MAKFLTRECKNLAVSAKTPRLKRFFFSAKRLSSSYVTSAMCPECSTKDGEASPAGYTHGQCRGKAAPYPQVGGRAP